MATLKHCYVKAEVKEGSSQTAITCKEQVDLDKLDAKVWEENTIRAI